MKAGGPRRNWLGNEEGSQKGEGGLGLAGRQLQSAPTWGAAKSTNHLRRSLAQSRDCREKCEFKVKKNKVVNHTLATITGET